MASYSAASEHPLIARADRAIADAVATCEQVRAELRAAGRNVPHRALPDRGPGLPAFPDPMPWATLEPWWSLARTVQASSGAVRPADDAFERAWHHVLPTIETPLGLFRG